MFSRVSIYLLYILLNAINASGAGGHIGSSMPIKKIGMFSLGIAASILINVGNVDAIFGLGGKTLYETASDIPSQVLKEKKEINGRIISISDGDTYRFRHVPEGLFSSNEKFDGPIKYHTIVVRVAAVDTPEIAKFGKPGQAFSQEAKDFATQKLLNQKVVIKCLSRDQYGRLLAQVSYKEGLLMSSDKDIAEELLKKGLAVVYRSGGANYAGKGVGYWNDIEAVAKKDKRGIWSMSDKSIELPSEYKKKMKLLTKSSVNSKN